MFGQVRRPEEISANTDYKKIFLYRRNITERLLSGLIAHRTKSWAIPNDQRQYNLPEPLHIDVSKMEKDCHSRFTTICKLMTALKGEYIILCYEDLVDDQNQLNLDAFNKARQFVGLPKLDSFVPPIKKQTSREYYERNIENLSEIDEVIGPTYGKVGSRDEPQIWHCGEIRQTRQI